MSDRRYLFIAPAVVLIHGSLLWIASPASLPQRPQPLPTSDLLQARWIERSPAAMHAAAPARPSEPPAPRPQAAAPTRTSTPSSLRPSVSRPTAVPRASARTPERAHVTAPAEGPTSRTQDSAPAHASRASATDATHTHTQTEGARQGAAQSADSTAPSLELPSSQASYLRNPRPPYPLASKRLRESGTVVLRVRVGADGTAQQVRIQRSSGYPALDESAQDTVQRWRFVPGKRHGVATAMDYDVPIAFRLD